MVAPVKKAPKELKGAFSAEVRKCGPRQNPEKLDGPFLAHPYTVSVSGPLKKSETLPILSFHLSGDVKDSMPADCYLQIWELDFFNEGRYADLAETDTNPRLNRKLASFPGVIVRAEGKHQFRVTQGAARTIGTPDQNTGKLVFKFSQLGETSSQEFTIHLPEYETVYELSAALVLRSDDQSHGEAASLSLKRCEPVPNVEASLRRQLQERKGLAVAFVADGQNPEFGRQAEQMISTLPTFVYDAGVGKIKFGNYLVTSHTQILTHLNDLKQRLQAVPNLGLGGGGWVSTLAIYCHGLREKALTGSGDANRLIVNSAKDFVSSVQGHLSPNVVVPIFACNCGRSIPAVSGTDKHVDQSFGRPNPCDELGSESLGWTLQRRLMLAGCEQASVYAHTTAAHTTWNANLRVFSKFGSADLINLLMQRHRFTGSGREQFISKLRVPEQRKKESAESVQAYNEYKKQFLADFKVRIRRAHLIRAISEVNAMYLPWEWQGGKGGDKTTPGFTNEAKKLADDIYLRLSSVVQGVTGAEAEEFSFTPDRRFLIGCNQPAGDPKLSCDFTWSNISTLANPMKLSVQLMRSVQVLHRRVARALVPREITLSGNEIGVEVRPPKYKKLAKDYEAAKSDQERQKALQKLQSAQDEVVQKAKTKADELLELGLFHKVEIRAWASPPKPPAAAKGLFCSIGAIA